jgi:hypothetical protein
MDTNIPEKKYICYKNVLNTVNIIGYYHICNKMHLDNAFEREMIKMIIKGICKKNNYNYNEDFQLRDLIYVFCINWYSISIHIMDICEIIYHVYRRNYKKIIKTLETIKIKKNDDHNIIITTISEIIKYIEIKVSKCKLLNSSLICLLYKYLEIEIDFVKKNDKLRLMVHKKANELSYDISTYLYRSPEYYKEYIINLLTVMSQKLLDV